MKLMCKNMTQAMKANRLLHDNGISSRVDKITDAPEIKGCVYVIVFSDEQTDRVLKLITEKGIVLHKKETANRGFVN